MELNSIFLISWAEENIVKVPLTFVNFPSLYWWKVFVV